MYSRFEALKSYDLDNLRDSTALIVGLGATGSVMANHLARHGVNLVLVDRDFLEPKDVYSSNLYSKKQCEKALPKAKAAEEKLSQLTEVESVVENLDLQRLEDYKPDIILDGTDNLETRMIIDEYSSQEDIPWVFTSALAERGFSMFVKNECFQCLFQGLKPSSSCENNGVMREISSMAASKSSLKAVKYLSGEEVEEKLEMVPEGKMFEPVECSCDSTKDFEVNSVCGENKYQVFGELRPENLNGELLVKNKYLKRVEIEGRKLTLFESGRAVVEAESEDEAKRLYKQASSI